MPHTEATRGRRLGLIGETLLIAALAALIAGVYLSFAQYGFDVLEEDRKSTRLNSSHRT